MNALSINTASPKSVASVRSSLAARIAAVREMANQALVRFTQASETKTSETILLKDGELFGFKFTRGSFMAVWKIEGSDFEIFRERTLLQRVTLETAEVRRAA